MLFFSNYIAVKNKFNVGQCLKQKFVDFFFVGTVVLCGYWVVIVHCIGWVVFEFWVFAV